MTKPTMEEYMNKTREDYGSGVAWLKFDKEAKFELNDQFFKELRENAFIRSEHEDASEHVEKIFEIVYLFTIEKVTIDQLMLRVEN